jgi:hypothetical protein
VERRRDENQNTLILYGQKNIIMYHEYVSKVTVVATTKVSTLLSNGLSFAADMAA